MSVLFQSLCQHKFYGNAKQPPTCVYCGKVDKAPPRPLQPGDKVLVEAEVLHVYTTDAEVEMTSSTMQIPLFSNRHLAINIPLSSIRPFPQEEV